MSIVCQCCYVLITNRFVHSLCQWIILLLNLTEKPTHITKVMLQSFYILLYYTRRQTAKAKIIVHLSMIACV